MGYALHVNNLAPVYSDYPMGYENIINREVVCLWSVLFIESAVVSWLCGMVLEIVFLPIKILFIVYILGKS